MGRPLDGAEGASRQENTEQHGEELPLDDELSDQPQEQASDDEGEEEDDEYRDTFQDDDDEDWVDPSEGAVFSATEAGDADSLAGLLERLSVSPDTPGEDGDSALHLACLYGHSECARLLLEAGSSAVATDEDGGTPLHDASAGGFMDIVTMLIDAGAASCVNKQDEDGETPLHVAARGEHLELVTLLLKLGADPRITSHAGRTAAQEACESPQVFSILGEAEASYIGASSHEEAS